MRIEFADDITVMDHHKQKQDFYSVNKGRDLHCDISEEQSVYGYEQYTMVRITDSDPSEVNMWGFYFLLLFSQSLNFTNCMWTPFV